MGVTGAPTSAPRSRGAQTKTKTMNCLECVSGLYNSMQEIGLFHATQTGQGCWKIATLAERVSEAFYVRVRSRISQILGMCAGVSENFRTWASKSKKTLQSPEKSSWL